MTLMTKLQRESQKLGLHDDELASLKLFFDWNFASTIFPQNKMSLLNFDEISLISAAI